MSNGGHGDNHMHGDRGDGGRDVDNSDAAGGGRLPPSGSTPRSRWWYLLPIFLDIVGGIIAYFVLRHDDPQKAKNCLLLGAVLFVMHLAVVGAGIAFWYALPDW